MGKSHLLNLYIFIYSSFFKLELLKNYPEINNLFSAFFWIIFFLFIYLANSRVTFCVFLFLFLILGLI